MSRDKETKNAIRFATSEADADPNNLYLKKSTAGDAKTIEVTVTKTA